MSHEIETTAWTNEVPWHGLGTEVGPNMTTEQMMKAAGLDWSVTKEPMFIKAGGKQIKVPDAFALTRDSDHSILDVCGNAYTPVQNAESFEFFREFVEAGDATMETAGSLKGGRMIWVLANLGKSFKLAGKDEVKGYLLLANPHQQGKSQKMMFTNVRVVCNNTLTAALRRESGDGTAPGNVVRRAHRGEFNEVARENAKASLGIAREQFAEFKEFALEMSHFKMDLDATANLIARAFGDDDMIGETAEVMRKDGAKGVQFALQALDSAPGAKLASSVGTAWGALNAVTYVTDHLIRNSADSRMYNAWFGRSAVIKHDAIDAIKREMKIAA
jgi:phage/plasmid-like protein (TIGR03299 family)